jgi:hypothetical protein
MAITLRGKDGKDVHLRAKPVNNDFAVCVWVYINLSSIDYAVEDTGWALCKAFGPDRYGKH